MLMAASSFLLPLPREIFPSFRRAASRLGAVAVNICFSPAESVSIRVHLWLSRFLLSAFYCFSSSQPSLRDLMV